MCVCLYEKGGIEYSIYIYVRRTKKREKNQHKQEEEEEDYEKLYKIKKHHIEY
jgi:hypothetical protein